MTLTTAQARQAWAPRCRGPYARVKLHGRGSVSVRPAIVEAVKAMNACYVYYNYQTRQADTGATVCRQIAASGNWSLHAYGIAIDTNWSTNPFSRRLITDMPRPMINAILAIRTNNGQKVWGWGGNFSGSKDAMHTEIICRPSDLATGINWSTVIGANGAKPAPKPKPPAVKPKPPEYDMDIVHETDTGAHILFAGFEWSHVSEAEKNAWSFIGVPVRDGTSAAVKARIAQYKLDKRVPRDH